MIIKILNKAVSCEVMLIFSVLGHVILGVV